jgi:hypothetical protein
MNFPPPIFHPLGLLAALPPAPLAAPLVQPLAAPAECHLLSDIVGKHEGRNVT